ncbi:MAG TPA: O-antigen ligase family protein, partial [Candidatus Bathyarchaeia archaeon]|nr:O-antigen ligase family protein [Candidatus Bathyarchaeia archaeon]
MIDIKNFFENIKSIFKKELTILWIVSVLLGFALIALQIKNKLPLVTGDFVFISILALCVALYRPRWMFHLFVSLVPLENVIFASGSLPIQLRPYQFAGAILAVAVIILWIVKRLNFSLLKPTWIDWLVFSLVPLNFLSLINSPNKNISLKNDLILFSFVLLYYIARNFLRKKSDFIEATFFFLASNLVVLGYGFWQIFADKFGARSFEVMFGRPNATFAEADWLGIFLCFALAINLTLALSLKKGNIARIGNYIFVFLNLTLLILTLSRSAWIGAAAVIFFFLGFNLFGKGGRNIFFTPRQFASRFLIIFLISLVSLTAVHFGKLSKFDIFDRARSAATNKQKITIACDNSHNIPETISGTDELSKYNCRFINLEEIASSKSQGKFVTEIFRKDPNVMTRSQIYKKSFEILREHPALGVGFGTITQALGTDERG